MKLPLRLNAYDVKNNCFYRAVLDGDERGHSLVREAEGQPESSLYISPGWIDIHTHIYDGFSYLGVPADSKAGIEKGVHIAADAGTAGAATIAGLVKYILPSNRTKIKVWIHINKTGIVHSEEGKELELMKAEDAVKAANTYKELVCGIKVRVAGPVVRDAGIEPLIRAKHAAVQAGLPLMVHIGQAPPDISEVLSYLDKGDIVSHVFHGKADNPWNGDGTPVKALKDAMHRGVRLDLAHGLSAFSFEILKKALSYKLPSFTISTDLHTRCINGPVFDLSTTMTKAYACGLPLNEVIKSVTHTAADAINEKYWGFGYENSLEHATIFELSKNLNGIKLFDSMNVAVIPEKIIIPRAVVFKGDLIEIP